jgi:hypothetical protein
VGLQKMVSRETSSAIQRQVVPSIETKRQVSTNPFEALPLLVVPLYSTEFSFDTTVAKAAPSGLPASGQKVLRKIKLTSALALHNVQTCNSLVTPAQQDAINKSRKTAVALAKKRKMAVAAAPADNGSGVLADEPQQNQVGPGGTILTGPSLPAPPKQGENTQHHTPSAEPIVNGQVGPGETSLPSTTPQVNTTTMPVAADSSLPKPKKKRKKTQHPVPSAEPIVNGLPELKCQGCVHCDVLGAEGDGT